MGICTVLHGRTLNLWSLQSSDGTDDISVRLHFPNSRHSWLFLEELRFMPFSSCTGVGSQAIFLGWWVPGLSSSFQVKVRGQGLFIICLRVAFLDWGWRWEYLDPVARWQLGRFCIWFAASTTSPKASFHQLLYGDSLPFILVFWSLWGRFWNTALDWNWSLLAISKQALELLWLKQVMLEAVALLWIGQKREVRWTGNEADPEAGICRPSITPWWAQRYVSVFVIKCCFGCLLMTVSHWSVDQLFIPWFKMI